MKGGQERDKKKPSPQLAGRTAGRGHPAEEFGTKFAQVRSLQREEVRPSEEAADRMDTVHSQRGCWDVGCQGGWAWGVGCGGIRAWKQEVERWESCNCQACDLSGRGQTETGKTLFTQQNTRGEGLRAGWQLRALAGPESSLSFHATAAQVSPRVRAPRPAPESQTQALDGPHTEDVALRGHTRAATAPGLTPTWLCTGQRGWEASRTELSSFQKPSEAFPSTSLAVLGGGPSPNGSCPS